MDAFEKLAKPAGASVESVGEGLPRTRAEALALGVARYFTGNPCKWGHTAERHAVDGKCIECFRRYRATPESKERARRYAATPARKESMRRYAATPEGRAGNRRYKLAKTGDAALFAVGQALQIARGSNPPADIIPQCPEPQRSRLQALVDRIKADPKAGKAVVGLLQTMRELRKAELAEMKAAAEGGAA